MIKRNWRGVLVQDVRHYVAEFTVATSLGSAPAETVPFPYMHEVPGYTAKGRNDGNQNMHLLRRSARRERLR